MSGLLEAQHYRLACWRDWRRRAELAPVLRCHHADRRSGWRTPDVFAATHRLLLSLVAEGLMDGLRVDHPDGLADPRGYLGGWPRPPAAPGWWQKRS